VTSTLSRRRLINLHWHEPKPTTRPPWAVPERAFIETCTACLDCASACPESIIVEGTDGLPLLDFSRGGCTFCGACRDACEPNALSSEGRAFTLKARIGNACIASRGTLCSACIDRCDHDALTSRLAGIGRPRLNEALCTGCGACIAACPVQAVEIVEVDAS
jgi:ferredoxin-type protein NapF